LTDRGQKPPPRKGLYIIYHKRKEMSSMKKDILKLIFLVLKLAGAVAALCFGIVGAINMFLG